jgi:hypothetical protein
MSMICWVVGLSSTQIGALRAKPSLASDLAMVAENDQMRARLDEVIKRMPPERRAAFEAQYRNSVEAAPAARAVQARIGEARTWLARIGPFEQALNLEKSWHMLHYLATGHTDVSNAPGDALLTGEPLGEDAGYTRVVCTRCPWGPAPTPNMSASCALRSRTIFRCFGTT